MGRPICHRDPTDQGLAVKFVVSTLPGVVVVEAEPHPDDRGFFARLYSPNEFGAAGIDFKPVQVNLSRNARRHTLRGMHYQDPPHAEAKLVQIVRGAAYDVVVDLRPASPAYGNWVAFTLDSSAPPRAIYIPEGCAHGFLTLQPDTDILYYMGRIYEPGHAKGFRWDDRRLAIKWPAEPMIISDADRAWPDFSRS